MARIARGRSFFWPYQSLFQLSQYPEYQGTGLGQRLMDFVEDYARKCGASELALDTSEHAHHLISMYQKRGYRPVEHTKWAETNYRSVVLSKTLRSQFTAHPSM